jgi:hypothetical protein
MAEGRGLSRLLLVVLEVFVFLFFFVPEKIAVLARFLLLFLFFLVIKVVRDEVQMDGMGLRDFEFGLALGTAQDFAFLDFVFVNVNFGGTFRAADHGSILRSNVRRAAPNGPCCRHHGVLYTALSEVNCLRTAAASIVNCLRVDFLK